MAIVPAVHLSGTNGSYTNLSTPARQELVEKLRGLINMREATAEELIQAVLNPIGPGRPTLESMPSQLGMDINHEADCYSPHIHGHNGTMALRTAIAAELESLLVEPSADPAPVAVEAPVADAPDAAHNGAAAAPKAAKPRKRKPKGKKHNGVPTAMTTQTMAPLPPAHQRVIQALKDQRIGADESTQGLLDAMIQAAEQNDRVSLEAIRTQVGTNSAIMRMFGLLWAALEDTQTRNATLLMEAAAGFHPRASFLAGRALFRDSVAQIRQGLASANPDMAIAPPEHDDDSQSES